MAMQDGMSPNAPMPGVAPTGAQQDRGSPPPGAPGAPPPEQPLEQELPPVTPDPQQEARDELDRMLRETNLCEELEEEEEKELANQVYEGYENDKASRQKWIDAHDDWIELALQYKQVKNTPWPNASNIKYPLLSTAAMQFAARAYPSLIPGDTAVVRAKNIIPHDNDGKVAAEGQKVAEHMNVQILNMPEWQEEMDKMLFTLSIVGTAFKKTYWCPLDQDTRSTLVSAKDLVVNYWTKSLETAERITQDYYYTKRQVEEMVRSGQWEDPELGRPLKEESNQQSDPKTKLVEDGAAEDETTPYHFIEQHTWFDINDDGYPEPVIVTMHHLSKKIVRVQARWASDSVLEDAEGKIIRIKPICYYTKYSFIPNPDGSFYDIGFGQLVGPLNEAVNTLANQVIDAGTLANLQSGFIAKGLRTKMGTLKVKPGEWITINAVGTDLKNSIVPLPAKEPSAVLFQLLGMIVQSVKELSSMAEIMTGKLPGQNTPAYTTKEAVDQGMKVFTAIYKRIYRSMAREFEKIFEMNRLYLDDEYASWYDEAKGKIQPAADPDAASQGTKQAKAEALTKMMQMGLNQGKVKERLLEALEIPNWRELLPDPNQPPPPPPEVQKAQMESKMAQEEHQLKMQEMQMEMQFKEQELQMKLKFLEEELNIKRQALGIKQQETQMQMQLSQQQHQQDSMMQQQDHENKLIMSHENHVMGMQQAKEKAAMKPKEKPSAKGNNR